MGVHEGKVIKIELDEKGSASAWITCPPPAVPSPGQYTLVISSDDDLTLPDVLFPDKISTGRFRVRLPAPNNWAPSRSLRLRGPIGKKFQIPLHARQVALVGLGGSISRLMTLSDAALDNGCAVTLFADCDFKGLPTSLEAYPLSAFGEALSWADYIAAELPLELLSDMRRLMGVKFHEPACLVQVLIVSPVPCGGLGDCGACAVKTRRGWKHACQDGPIFDLKELDI